MSLCDIKSLYTNTRRDVFHKAIDYWIEKLINEIALLRRFTKAFVLEGLSIILEFNYYYINNYFYHQIKGFAMGIIFVVVGSNLTVVYSEEKMFAILPQIYPKDFFRFLDDVFQKWLIQFDIQDFYKTMNELNPDLHFIFEDIYDIMYIYIYIYIYIYMTKWLHHITFKK